MKFDSHRERNTGRKSARKFIAMSILLCLIFMQGCAAQSANPSDTSTVPIGSGDHTPEPSAAASSAPEKTPAEETAAPEPTASPEPTPEVYTYDVIVYGATPAGVMAATEASRAGLSAAILEPGRHLGGMISGGLGFSDIGNSGVIGGLAKEFYIRTGILYLYAGNEYKLQYYIEPHVAENVFSWFVEEAGVDVFFEHRLKETDGVQKSGTTIKSVTTEDQSVFYAKEFIDCSYEGDLMAMSGVSYTVGREGQSVYGETLAGVRPFVLTNNFYYHLSAYSMEGELMSLVSDEALAEIGSGDQKLPAYNFRLCLTDQTDNQVMFEKPDGYDPSEYELLLQWIYLLKGTEGNRDLTISDLFYMGNLLGGKTDANNSGPISSDYIGHSWDYPEADYETREKIIQGHKQYLQGMLYFLANDEEVPEELRADVGRWGLAADEFTDNDNWPYQLYIREARRMIGDFVLTQKDLQTEREKTDAVGMGSYTIDSHHIQRVITEEGYVMNEGEIQVLISPYQLPYEIITPQKAEADNLLVPVCVSASHVAYSSIRMEPQYMILGQAAGLAAKLAIEQNCPVQEIDTATMQSQLEQEGAILTVP